MSFIEKSRTHFPLHTVRKDLPARAAIDFLPRYISESIIATTSSSTSDLDDIIQKARNLIHKYHPRRDSTELLKHALIENRVVRILSNLVVQVNLTSEIYYSFVPSLGQKVLIPPDLPVRYPQLLTNGIWGIGTYELNEEGKLLLQDFNPVQVGSFDFAAFVEGRTHFTSSEWIDLMVASIGYNPAHLKLDQKLYILARLIPLVEKNVNMAEWGPKGTGKTFIYRNLGGYCHVISGSAITPARLIVSLGTMEYGILMTADCAVFDEVTGAKFGAEKDWETIGILKDYMEGGKAARGKVTISSDTSIMYLGNIDVKDQGPKYGDYSKDLPPAFADTAFLDRINGVIPGWKIPKIRGYEESFFAGEALTFDFLSEAFHYMRHWDHPSAESISRKSDSLLIRNQKSIRKLIGGLLKILFPGVRPSDEEERLVLRVATELRQNVYDQLVLIDPDEFPSHLLVPV